MNDTYSPDEYKISSISLSLKGFAKLKGYAKLTIYALILGFFLLYQLYFLGHLGIIFAATPIIFAATDVTPASPTTYNVSGNISFSLNISTSGGARIDSNGTIFQIGRNITTSFTNITRCTPIAGGGGLPQSAGIACVWNKTPSVFVINFTQQTYDEAGLSNYTWYANDSSGAGNKTVDFRFNYTINPGPATLVISNNTASLNTSDMVGYWRFEEGSGTAANDSSGNGNNGTLGNSSAWVIPTWTTGIFGSALNFNGSQFVNISDSASLNITGNIALAAWIYTNSTSSSQRIIGKFTLSGNSIYMLRLGAAGNGKLDFYVSPLGSVPLISASTLSANTWYYVVGTYDGSNARLYVNGNLDNTTAATGSISEGAGSVYIGANPAAGAVYFNGTIDEPQIWDRVLTASEIYELYQSKVTYPTSTTFTGSNCPTSAQGGADVTCNLYRNQTLKSGSSETATLGAGWTYYVYNTSGGTNYTATSILIPVNISKGTPTIALSNNTASVNTSQLAGYWKLDEGNGNTAFDSSGNGNDGSLVGNAIWTYRQPITISNSGSTLTNYQINVTLDTASLISAGKMNSACQDIRFVDSDDLTQLNYWIETGCNTVATTIWVNVTTISNPSTTMYIYYGNSSATSNSNLTTVFENVFTQPSFESATGWTYTEADVSGNGCIPTLPSSLWSTESSNSYYQYCGFSSFYTGEYYGREYQTKSFPAGYNYIIRFDVNTSTVTSPYGSVEVLNGTTVIWSTTQENTLLPNQETAPISSGSNTIYFGTHVTAAAALRYALAYFDNIRVRKYVTQQPTTSFGSEQSMFSWTSGMFGSALKLNGSQFVNATNSSSLNPTSAITISAWIKTISDTTSQRIVSRSNSASNRYYLLRLGGSNTGKVDFAFTTNGGTPNFINGVSSLSNNIWYFVVATYDGSNAKIYVNGNLDNSTSATGSIDTIADSTYIGTNIYSGLYFNGTLDEVQIWNRSLTASEIDELYQSSATYPTQTNFSLVESNPGDQDVNYEFFRNGTVSGIWHFDEGSGSIAVDSSGTSSSALIGSNVSWTSNGKYGNALIFNGSLSSDFVNTTNNANYPTLTVIAWVNPADTLDSYEVPIAKYDYGNGGQRAWKFQLNPDVGIGRIPSFQIFPTPSNGGDYFSAYSGVDIYPNTWSQIAATYNGTVSSIYVNGKLAASTTNSSGIPSTSAFITIGDSSNSDNGQSFNGTIDEVKIYPRALSAAEILCNYGNNCTQSIYNNETAIVGAGLSYYVGRGSGGQNWTIGSLLLPLNVSKGTPLLNLTLNVSSPITTVTGYQAVGSNCTMLGGSDITCTLYRGNSSFFNSTAPYAIGTVTDQGTLAAGVYAFNFSSIAGQNWTSASATNASLTVFVLNPRNTSAAVAVRPSQNRQGLGKRILFQPLRSNPITQRLESMVRAISITIRDIFNAIYQFIRVRPVSLGFAVKIGVPQTTVKLFRSPLLQILFNQFTPSTVNVDVYLKRNPVLNVLFSAIGTRVEKINRQVTAQIRFAPNIFEFPINVRSALQNFKFSIVVPQTTERFFRNPFVNFAFTFTLPQNRLLFSRLSQLRITASIVEYENVLMFRLSSLRINLNAVGTRTTAILRNSFIAINLFTNNIFKSSYNRITSLQFYFASINATTASINSNITATQNVWVLQGSANTNNYGFTGGGTILRTVNDNAGAIRSYIRFNLSAANVPAISIKDAKVSLHQSGLNLNGGNLVGAYEVVDTGSNDNWNESFITWNNQPCGSTGQTFNASCNTTAGDSATISGAEINYNWTVTQFAQRALSRNSRSFTLVFTNLSLELSGSDLREDFASSRNSTAYAPVLYLNYSTYGQLPVTRQYLGRISIALSSTFNLNALRQILILRTTIQKSLFSLVEYETALFNRINPLRITTNLLEIETVFVNRINTLRLLFNINVPQAAAKFFRNSALQIQFFLTPTKLFTSIRQSTLQIANNFALTISRGSLRTVMQAATFSFNNIRMGLFSRAPNVQIGISTGISRVLALFRSQNLQILMDAIVVRSRANFATATLRMSDFFALTISRGSARIVFQNFVFSFNSAQKYLLARFPNVQISFTQIGTRMTSVFRNAILQTRFLLTPTRTLSQIRQAVTGFTFTLSNLRQFGTLRVQTLAILFNINVPQTRETFSRNPFLNILFNFNLPDTTERLYRNPTLNILFTAFATRTQAANRALTAQLSFSTNTLRIPIFIRSALQNFFLNFNVPQTTERFMRNPLLNILFSFNVPRSAQSLYRNINQSLSFTAFATRILSVGRTVYQAFSFDFTTSRLFGTLRTTSQAILFSNAASRAFGSVRAVTASVTSNFVVSRMFSAARTIVSQISFSSAVQRMVGFGRAVSQPLYLNFTSSRLSGVLRTVAQNLRLNITAVRILGFTRAANQILTTNVIAIRTLSLFRTAAQSLSATAFATRLAAFGRVATTYFNFSVLSQASRSLQRTLTLSIQFFTSVPQTKEIFSRNPVLRILFSFNAPRGAAALYRTVAQAISFNAFATRIATFARTVTSSFNLTIVSQANRSFLRIATAVINIFTNVPQTMEILKRNPVLNILFNINVPQTRELFSRNPALTVIFSAFATRIQAIGKAVSLNILFSTVGTRIQGFGRFANLNVLFSTSGTRILIAGRQAVSRILFVFNVPQTRELFSRINTLNILFNFQLAQTRAALARNANLNILFTFNVPQARQLLSRNPTLNVLFTNAVRVSQSLYRNVAQSISFTAFATRIATFTRTVATSINFTAFVPSVGRSFLRIASTVINFFTNVPQTTELFRRNPLLNILFSFNIPQNRQLLLRNPTLNILFTTIATRIQSLGRTVTLNILFTTFRANFQNFARFTNLNILFTSSASRVLTATRQIAARILFNFNLPQTIETFSRNPVLSILFTFRVPSSVQSIYRNIAQSLTFSFLTRSISNLTRAATLAPTFTAFSIRILSAARAVAQSITLRAFIAGFSGIGRTVSQNIMFSVFSTRMLSLARTVPLSFTVSSTSIRLFSAFRAVYQSFSTNFVTRSMFGLLRTATSAVTFNAISSRTASLSRTVSQSFTFTAIAQRLVSFRRTVTQAINFSSFAQRFFGISRAASQAFSVNFAARTLLGSARFVSQQLAFSTSISRIFTALRTSSQAIYFTALTRGGFAYFAKIATQQISFTAISSRIAMFTRAVTTSFRFVAFVPQSAGQSFQRVVVALVNFLTSAQRIETLARNPILNILFSFNVPRGFGTLYRNVTQAISFNAFATRMAAFNRIVTTYFTFFARVPQAAGQSFARIAATIINFFANAQPQQLLFRNPFLSTLFASSTNVGQTLFRTLSLNILFTANTQTIFAKIQNIFNATASTSFNFISGTSQAFLNVRLPIQAANFNAIGTRMLLLLRTSALQQTFSTVAARISTFGRLVTTYFNFSVVVPQTSRSFLRIANTLVNFFTNIPQTTEILKRNPTLNILFSFNVPRAGGTLYRNIVQFITFNTVASRMSATYRLATQTITFNIFATRIDSFGRAISQAINFNSLATRLTGTLRTASQYFSVSAIATRISIFSRLVTTQLNFNAFASQPGRSFLRIASAIVSFFANIPQPSQLFSRSPVLNVLFSFNVPRGFGFVYRTVTQQLSFNAFATRIATFQRTVSENFVFNTIASRAFGISGLLRVATTGITFSAFSSRALTLARAATTAFNLNTVLNTLIGTARTVTQNFSTSFVATSSLNLMRAAANAFNFTSAIERTLALTKSVSESFTFSSLSERFYVIGRTALQTFAFSQLTSFSSGVLRIVAQSFTTNFVVSTASSLFRSASQPIILTFASLREFLALRTVSSSITLLSQTTTQMSRLREALVAFQLNNVVTRSLLAFRQSTFQLTIVQGVQRQLSLFRQAATSLLTFPTASRISTLFRTIFSIFQISIGTPAANVTTGTTTTTSVTSATSQPPGPSAGGGGIPPIAPLNISFEPSEIVERLGNGEKDIVGLKISNNGNYPVQINLRLSTDIINYITLDRTSFTIGSKSEELVRVSIAIPPEEVSHVIEGSIAANVNGVTYNVPVTLIVTSKIRFLLDVRTEIPEAFRTVSAGGKVEANITIFNLGQEGRVDVDLMYGVRNSSIILATKEEFLAVKDKVSLMRTIDIPRGTAPGTYQFFANASYANATAKSFSEFNVLTPQQIQIRLFTILLLAFLAGAILLIIAVAYRRKKKEQRTVDVYAKIQKIRGELTGGAGHQLSHSTLLSSLSNIKLSLPKFSIPYPKSSNASYRKEAYPAIIKSVKSSLENNFSYQFPEKERLLLRKFQKKLVSG